MSGSRLSGFHNLNRVERLNRVAAATGLSADEVARLAASAGADGDLADNLSENVIGVMAVPLGVATNLIVDGRDVLVPMATEESSVIAAVCNGALACRDTGGVTTEADPPEMIAQIQITGLADIAAAQAALAAREGEIGALCDACDPKLVDLGGGFRQIELRPIGDMLILHLVIDVRDAMGANAVNTMAEALAPRIETWTGGKVGLRILSNLADRRKVTARAVWPRDLLGAEIVNGILAAHAFASADPYRAATHNKGIMNGVSAVALATGNDTRALEAGAHAFAAQGGYGPLSRWALTAAGDLEGRLEMPLAVGIIGGATKAHPTARTCLKIMGVESAGRLARVIAAVGLVQNFSALRALAGEGIQRGHMGLHARNIAIAAGAAGDQITRVADAMVARGEISESTARDILAGL